MVTCYYVVRYLGFVVVSIFSVDYDSSVLTQTTQTGQETPAVKQKICHYCAKRVF